MTLSLPNDVQAIIHAKIASGEFSSESDVVAAGVRLLLEEEQQRAQQTERLRAMLQEAVDDFERGDYQDVDEAFDEVELELFGKRLADE
jgi:putative addiction module CopG family antidote